MVAHSSLSRLYAAHVTIRAPPRPAVVWIQLYVGDQESGRATRILCKRDSIIDDFARLVKTEYPEFLNCFSSAHLLVYPHGTPLDALNHDGRLRPGGPVPGGTTDEQPLLVMAPSAAVPQLGKCL